MTHEQFGEWIDRLVRERVPPPRHFLMFGLRGEELRRYQREHAVSYGVQPCEVARLFPRLA